MKRTARRLRRKVLSVLMSVALIMAMMPAEFVLADDNVCEVNGVPQTTFPSMVSTDNTTVKLLQDVTSDFISCAKNVTLDLNGYTISGSSYPVGLEEDGAELKVIGNGTISTTSGSAIYVIADGCYVSVGKDVTLNGKGGIWTWNPNTTVDFDGKIVATGADTIGLYVSGNLEDTTKPCIFNVGSTADIATSDTGIYGAGYAIWNVYGKVVGANVGIEIRAGELNVYDGADIQSTATSFSNVSNASGTTTVGAAISVVQHQTQLPIYVNIEGGDITGPTALFEKNTENNSQASIAQVQIDVSGGTFTSDSSNVDLDTVVVSDVKNFISGGTFNEELDSDYVSEGCSQAESSGTYGIAVQYVAKINDTYYETLADAFGAASDDDTIVLINNTCLDATIDNNKTVTLDLNGKDITVEETSAGRHLYAFENYGNMTIEDSSVSKKGSVEARGVSNNVGATLTVSGGTLVGCDTNGGAGVWNEGTLNVSGGTLKGAGYAVNNQATGTVNMTSGTVIGSYGVAEAGELNISGGTIESTAEGGMAIEGVKDSGAQINISGGAAIKCLDGYGICLWDGCELTMTGGSIQADAFGISNNGIMTTPTEIAISGGTIEANDVGIYHAGIGTLTISDDAYISGGTGIEMRAGTLNVSGGTIVGTADSVVAEPNGGGSSSQGAGIAVVQHTTKKDIAVNVTGGTIQGYSAFYEANPEKNSSEDIDKISIEIEDGSFETINGGTEAVYSEDKDEFITGGTFSSDPSDYTDNGYTGEPNGSGGYGVVTGVAKIDDTVYETLAEAVAAAQAGDTIKMVGNVELNATQTIAKELTLDLNGCTISGNNIYRVIDITTSGNLTIDDSSADGDGKITIPQTHTGKLSETIHNHGAVTVNGGIIENKDAWEAYAIRCDNAASPSDSVTVNGGTIISDGGYGVTVWHGDSFTMTGGDIIAAYGISNTGNLGAPTTMDISGGTITGTEPDSVAIYHAGVGTLNISGGTLTGATGVEMRAGTLNMTGGTVIGTAEGLTCDPNGNGSTTYGAGIAVVQHTTKQPIEINVSGGNITAGVALYEKNIQKNSADAIAKVTADISGGTFTSTNTETGAAVASQDWDNFIRGGEFNTPIAAEDCATGYAPITEPNDQGMYTVEVAPDLVEVAPYKGNKTQENWTYPTEDGKIFAGWYTDDTCTTPYTGTTGAAYPKFVDEKVLKARAQLRVGEGGAADSLRFITNVDKMDYIEAGFIISNNGVESAKRAKVTKVFRTLIGNGNVQLPTQYSEDAIGFLIYNFNNLPTTGLDLVATPYWITADGTLVGGIASSHITSALIDEFKSH